MKQYDRISLRHTFTEDERRDIAAEMAEASVKKERLEDELKVIKADYKSQIESEEAIVKNSARKLQNGFEMRSTKCEKEFNHQSREVLWFHPETQAIVKRRTMTQDEMQMEFDFEGTN